MAANYPHLSGHDMGNHSDELREIVRLAAEPFRPEDNRKSLIARAARVLRLSYRRTSAIWYDEAVWPLAAAEVARLKAERARLLRLRELRLCQEIEETRREIEEALRREEALAADRAVAEPAGALDGRAA